MKKLLITLSLFLVSAGGIPLDESFVSLPEVQTKFIATIKELYDKKLEDTLAEIQPYINEPLDPEYIEILKEFEKNNNLTLLSHRDLQWKSVAQVMQEINVEDRIELIENVRRYPLYRSLPPTVAISPRALTQWSSARKIFIKAVKQVAK